MGTNSKENVGLCTIHPPTHPHYLPTFIVEARPRDPRKLRASTRSSDRPTVERTRWTKKEKLLELGVTPRWCPSWSRKGGVSFRKKMHSLLSGELFIGDLYTWRLGFKPAPGGREAPQCEYKRIALDSREQGNWL